MKSITLNDGTVLQDAYLIADRFTLFLYFPGAGMREIFDLMMDPEKTAVITATDGPTTEEYTRFTKLKAISDEGRLISAVMEMEV